MDEYLHPNEETPEGQKKRTRLKRGLRKIVSLPPENTPPVIIFEWEEEIKNLRARLPGTHKENTLFIVPTGSLDPIPRIPNMQLPLGIPIEKHHSLPQWQAVITKLKDLGVKKIMIAGSRLLIDHDQNEIQQGRCVGYVSNILKNDFSVDLSWLTSPDDRKNISSSQ